MIYVRPELFRDVVDGSSPEAIACKACGSLRIEQTLSLTSSEWGEARFSLLKCLSCGLGFLNPQPSDGFLRKHVYNEEYPLYDFDWVTSLRDSPLKRAYRAVFPHPLMQLIPSSPGTALDVGCGSGYWMHQLRLRGWRVAGIDTSLESIERLNKMGYEGI